MSMFKSKWHKVFKESDGDGQPLQLSDDVQDFLKPSTEKASVRHAHLAPKIDVAIAQRFPDAKSRAYIASESQGSSATQERAWIPLKPRRREDLTVAFVTSAPDVIGDGGDEAPDPPREISRRRADMSRSVSDSQLTAPPNSSLRSAPETLPARGSPWASIDSESLNNGFLAPPIRRANTTHNEFSPPMQKRQPAAVPTAEPRFNFKRAPTGLALAGGDALDDSPAYGNASARRRQMQANEGAALRRLSGINFTDKDDDLDIPVGHAADSEFYPPQPRTLEFRRRPDQSAFFEQSSSSPNLPADDRSGVTNLPGGGTQSVSNVSKSSFSPDRGSSFNDSHYVKQRSVGIAQVAATRDTSIPAQAEEALHAQHQQYPSLSSVKRDLSPNQSLGTAGTVTARSASDRAHPRSFSRPMQAAAAVQGSQLQPPPVQTGGIAKDDGPQWPTTSRQQVGQRSGNQMAPASSSYSSRPSPSSHARNPSPVGYVPASKNAQVEISPVFSKPQQQQRRHTDRSESSGSTPGLQPAQRPIPSPVPSVTAEDHLAANAALLDFDARIAHMKGAFRLTSDREQSIEQLPPTQWLRAAVWWYLQALIGFEDMLRQRSKNFQPREILSQAHVNLAKAWWIVKDYFGIDETIDDSILASARPGEELEPTAAKRASIVLRNQIRSTALSITEKQLLPPHQSLIQGQDTRIWIYYPRFTPGAIAVLGGHDDVLQTKSYARSTAVMDPLRALPISDTRDRFCYGRFAADVFLNTDETETDRVALPCMLTLLRQRHEYQASIAVASQSSLVNIQVGPRDREGRQLSWQEVSWTANLNSVVIRLSHEFNISVRLQEHDFRNFWNFVEYTRKIEHSFRPEEDEAPIYDARLAEAQYMDSSGGNVFPQRVVPGCRALLFEKSKQLRSGGQLRKAFRGFRFMLVTEAGHKMLNCVSHELCVSAPLLFEFRTDSENPNGFVAMVVKIREDSRQVRILLTFPNAIARQAFYEQVNGINVEQHETIISKGSIVSMNISSASHSSGVAGAVYPNLPALQWQSLSVMNCVKVGGVQNGQPSTIMSDSLRIVARHNSGCITDRLNMSKGELLFRLPCDNEPAIQILRQPQDDITMSIDTRTAPQGVVASVDGLYRLSKEQQTIRTIKFASMQDCHSFQAAITGFRVLFDGIASTFGISRRRMVVPIYKKWEASQVRLQVVSNPQQTVIQVVAFMEAFSHASAMVFQVKKTDDFESENGGKDKKWKIKLKDAKFSLPKAHRSDDEINDAVGIEQRFVNLEGLEYAEEHDDISIGFDSETECNEFAQALPAATTVGRGLTLKRRI